MSKTIAKAISIAIPTGIEEMFATHRFNNSTILHNIAYNLRYPGDGCCNEKRLSLLSKMLDRILPNLSIKSLHGDTPYDMIYLRDEDKGWLDQKAELIRPREYMKCSYK